MPQIFIDGKAYEYEGKHMLLQFALDNGVEIPFFCYHPAMSIPTNCRMCLVEVGWPATDRKTGEPKLDDNGQPVINWGRKPNTACNTPISPNMVVKTGRSSAQVKEMQAGVLEYMLVNHPLDCPICDQAGECPLQIWTYKYGPEGSRFESMKVHKPKRIDLGPNVIMDAERCINCTRCVRFTEEISGTDQLTIIGRGDKNYPATAPGKKFDDPYSMNTIDICPVGALTSKDFRFKARVWEMSYAPSICTGCSKGCNIDVWVRDNRVERLTPRDNLDVNQYWMCDAGRLDIDKYNEYRVSGPRVKGDIPVEFEEAALRAHKLIGGLAENQKAIFLGSAYASLESNLALKKLAEAYGRAEHLYYIPHVEEGWGDNLLRRDDRTPNAKGCEALGFKALDLDALVKDFKDKDVSLLYMLEDNTAFDAIAKYAKKVPVIVHATNHHEKFENCEVVFAAANEIEAESTFINGEGQAQVTKLGKAVTQMTPEHWMRIPKSRLDKAAVALDRWRDLDNVQDVMPGWQLVGMVADAAGKGLGWNSHKDVFAALVAELGEEALAGAKHSYRVPKTAFKMSQFDFAIR